MRYKKEDDLIFEAYQKSLNEADSVSGTIPNMSAVAPASTGTTPTSAASPATPTTPYNPKKPLGQALPNVVPGPNTKNSAAGAYKVLQNTFNSLQNQTDINKARQEAANALNGLGSFERDLKIHSPLSKDIQTAQDVPSLQQMVGKYLQWSQGLSK